MERTRHWQGLLITIVLVTLGGLYLWQNNQPSVTVSIPAATVTPVDAPPADWQVALEAQLASTPLPTPNVNATAYVPPTLPPTLNPDVLEPARIEVTPWPTSTPQPTTPPLDTGDATAFPSPTGIFISEPNQDIGFQPPPEEIPLSAHVNDHFWMARPVGVKANSESLFYYPFGSDGPNDEWRVHHGVDMPNDIGEPIHAGGNGVVAFAGDGGEIVDKSQIDIYPSYGNVVIIEHKFGYRGQKIYTLYAHMSSILVTEGQQIRIGDTIGLIGGTGDVSGPHVHMEVRLGTNKYFETLNPLLWIAPYTGAGVVAGRVTNEAGNMLDDVVVTLSQQGRVIETTTTYIKPRKPGQTSDWEVVPDPAWQENFVLGDIPAGDYSVSIYLGGRHIQRSITVKAGTTNFIDLSLGPAATAQPVDPGG